MVDENDMSSIDIMDSVLLSVKKEVAPLIDSDVFDADLLIYINGVFDIFLQLGITEEPVRITNAETKWADVGIPDTALGLATSQMVLRCKLLFDPPATTHVTEATEAAMREYEFRGMIAGEEARKNDIKN